MSQPIYSESEARSMPDCLACGRPKDWQTLVCERCYSYTLNFTPLHYFSGSFESWQEREVYPYFEEVKGRISGKLFGEAVPIRVIPDSVVINPEDGL